MNILEAINCRRSIRYFNGELPTQEQLEKILKKIGSVNPKARLETEVKKK